MFFLLGSGCSNVPTIEPESLADHSHYVCNIKYEYYVYHPRGCSFSHGEVEGKSMYNASASIHHPRWPKDKRAVTVAYREISDDDFQLTLVLWDKVLNIINPNRTTGVMVSPNETSILITFVSGYENIPKGTTLFFSREDHHHYLESTEQ